MYADKRAHGDMQVKRDKRTDRQSYGDIYGTYLSLSQSAVYSNMVRHSLSVFHFTNFLVLILVEGYIDRQIDIDR